MDEQKLRAQKREKDEPEELRSPVPKPLAILSVALLAWGAWYYFQNVGYPMGAGDRRTPISVVSSETVDGGIVYAGNCVACHQSSGMGLAGVFPPLVNSSWVLENDERLVQILLHGIQGELVVNEVTYNGVMPAFSQLSDAELAAVLTYIRTEWGNSGSAINATQIADGRQRFPDRTSAWAGGAELSEVFPANDNE